MQVDRGTTYLKIGSIVIRCFEFERMFAFWQEALHYVPKYPPEEGWVILRDPAGTGPNVSLDKAPQKRAGKRSWIHLDLYAGDAPSEVERLLNLGAARYPWRYPTDADYIVLEDPDGNLFCVIQDITESQRAEQQVPGERSQEAGSANAAAASSGRIRATIREMRMEISGSDKRIGWTAMHADPPLIPTTRERPRRFHPSRRSQTGNLKRIAELSPSCRTHWFEYRSI